jgi:hypothetical protein
MTDSTSRDEAGELAAELRDDAEMVEACGYAENAAVMRKAADALDALKARCAALEDALRPVAGELLKLAPIVRSAAYPAYADAAEAVAEVALGLLEQIPSTQVGDNRT